VLHSIHRNRFNEVMVFALAILLLGANVFAGSKVEFRIATFSADVTPPLGHPLMAGGIMPAVIVRDPLFARGFVLVGGKKPIVFVAVDWCEIRNEAYDRWQQALARAAGTEADHVLVTAVHVHDAPVADLEAQRILDANGATGDICDLSFHEEAVQRVARALEKSLSQMHRITHFGVSEARVEKVASNRRYLLLDGTPSYGRYSATRDVSAQAAPEGTIDPMLKTLSFWDGRKPVVALHSYAVHPMSHYGQGEVSADFVGMARARLQAENASVFQIYSSGCSGNVTAGKYNDGSPTNRPVLADRIYQAMKKSLTKPKRHRLNEIQFRTTALHLAPRTNEGFDVANLEAQLSDNSKPFRQCLAAMGLSWHKRAATGRAIQVPVMDLGAAQLLLLPAESYVEFQLFAQQQRPDSFVLVAGYGECAPGYIPIERAWDEKDINLHDWCWTTPGAEAAMKEVIEKVLPSPTRTSR
jgi:hypothetical protein